MTRPSHFDRTALMSDVLSVAAAVDRRVADLIEQRSDWAEVAFALKDQLDRAIELLADDGRFDMDMAKCLARATVRLGELAKKVP